MKQYISIDSNSKSTDTELHLENKKNEICGTLKTFDKEGEEPKDIKELFIQKSKLENIEKVNVESEEYSLESVAQTLNSLISALKGGASLALAICMLGCSSLAADPPGKQKLGDISAKTYVVTNEVDPTFSEFKNNDFSVELGYQAKAGRASVAIGVPLLTNASGGTVDGWSMNYLGPTEALDRSVAIGDSAKAMEKVSVAIGNQANVRGLHPDSGTNYTYNLKLMEVVSIKDDNGNVSVTTNMNYGINTYTVDVARFERLPIPNSRWNWKSGTTNGNKTTEIFEQACDFLYDIAYITKDERAYYDKIIQSGQGAANLMSAQYGVAVGSRAYVPGYHGAAFGHYAHVSRPFGLSIGSEAHSYSEGGQAIGYDTDIATNSPYSMAIGMNASIPSGMSNAIVIGVPDIATSGTRTYEGAIQNRPRAMKSNSINFVYNGNGLNDFFIDNYPITDRLASEVKVIGNSKKYASESEVIEYMHEQMNVNPDDNDLVLYSESKIRLFTGDYTEIMEKGDVSSVEVNGIPLSQIFIQRKELESGLYIDELETDNLYINGESLTISDGKLYVSGNPISFEESRFEAYHAIVTNQARIAFNAISNSTNFAEVKSALTNFFNNIK